ncbi:hypothetical protein DU002_15910 [Corallincola holothuriorum]|uniref:Uncharacterized protein n=1 Tax=Corallincola holothuriorum TaxID=2282215 RepID=A0A368N3R5_9GAMM|nr:hypothetical protein [Corallincola holothuriorum]RCU45207.1 hypothetical protein DU002_15910 [Corallincola holothuriorum]
MIDQESRIQFAELIRSLCSGNITNDDFEDSVPFQSEDRAISAVFYYGAWGIYSDMKEYKLRGKNRLSREDKEYAAKLILFLKSGFEYEWPVRNRKRSLLHRFTFGLFGEIEPDPWSLVGDKTAWPFLNISQLEQAKRQYGYLGKNT